MIISLQCGAPDKDRNQTRKALALFLGQHVSEGDEVLYVDQPITMMDQAEPVLVDMGASVTKVTPNFMQDGLEAVSRAMIQVVLRSDLHLVLAEPGPEIPVDREFASLVSFLGMPVIKKDITYEGVVVL